MSTPAAARSTPAAAPVVRAAATSAPAAAPVAAAPASKSGDADARKMTSGTAMGGTFAGLGGSKPQAAAGDGKAGSSPVVAQAPSAAGSKGAAAGGGAAGGRTAARGGGASAAASSAPASSAAPVTAAPASGKSAADAPAAEEKKAPAAGAKGAPGAAPAAGDKGAAAVAVTPTSPATDPAFQAVVKQSKAVATQQSTHAPAAAKAQEAQDAAVEPQAAILGKGQARQVDEMEQAPSPGFDAAGFKAALKKRIEELTPATLEEADEFKENDTLGGVKDEMSGKVEQEKAASQGPLEEKTEEAPSTAGIEAKPVTKLPPADIGKVPGPIGAGRAVPKKQQGTTVEAPLREASQSIDDQMAEENVTDEQMQKSNEPKFMDASKARSEAQENSESAPKAFRKFENKTLTKAEAEAVANAQKEVQGMYGDRSKGLTQVEGQQKDAKGKDESARAKVASDIEGIYTKTKDKVEGILNALDGKVEQAFDTGAAAAKQTFEDYVEEKMDEYKDERYSGLDGKIQWGIDLFLGLPEEVNKFYEDGRELYLQEMDKVLDEVISIIGTELTAAKTEIQKGKDEISTYVSKLPGDLKNVGQEAAAAVDEKFAKLEESIESKQGELIDSLAQKYQDNLTAVDERIKEMKEANKGLIDKAIGLIKDVIEAIKKLRKMLNQILNRIADVIGLILMDPIGFFENLVAGMKQGFNNFVDNIQKHLIAGLFAWLTGALGPMNIKIPDNLFSLKGIFNLVMQVLGLTWEYMRAKAVQMFGETVVMVMEKGAEIFMKLREGPDAVWEYVKEQFNDLKEMVIDQIKEMVITEVIKAGVKWILSLLNPAAAFIKAAMAIYSFVSFIFNRAAQILDFINSLLDAIEAIAKGKVDGAAALVEKALAKSIPLIIGLLAALLGISGLVTKVQKVIMKIRKRIDAAITKLLIKVKSLIGKVGSAVGGLVNWWKKKTAIKAGKETHSLYFTGEGRNAELMVASSPTAVKHFIDMKANEAKDDPKKKAAIDAIKVQLAEIDRLSRLPEDQQAANEAKFTAAFNAIAKEIPILMGGNKWGTKENPIPLDWQKPAISAYPVIYLGPKSKTRIEQKDLASAAGGTMNGKPVKEYKPTGRQKLPEDSESIGVLSGYQIDVGQKIHYKGDTPRKGNPINDLLKPYGYSPDGEKLAGDHIVELQIGGPNHPDNMWPLDYSTNSSGGSRLKNVLLKVPLPDGTVMNAKDEVKKRPDGLHFSIASTK